MTHEERLKKLLLGTCRVAQLSNNPGQVAAGAAWEKRIAKLTLPKRRTRKAVAA